MNAPHTRSQIFESRRLPSRSNFLQRNLARLSLATLSLIFLAIHPVRGQQQATPPPPQPDREESATSSSASSITGRVVDEAGQPLGNVMVYITSIGGVKVQRIIATDSGGKFQAVGLEPVVYGVNAFVAGYVNAPSVVPDSNVGRYYRTGDSVTLTLVKGGVITGAVTNSAGEPVVAAPVLATRVRDAEGRIIRARYFGRPRSTDDRGIYRLYGLEPGAYVVSVGGRGQFNGSGAYDNDVPTYAPSSTRDTAAEIIVRSGEEAGGIDIRYRGEEGRAVSGRIIGALNTSSPNVGTSVSLTRAGSGTLEAMTFSTPRLENRPFAFYGVPDGEYDITAQVFQYGQSAAMEGMASPPRRVTVKGANVTGIELTLAPLASINARLVLEPLRPDACASKSPIANAPDAQPSDARLLRQSVIILRRDDQDLPKDQARSVLPSGGDATPNDQGEFTFRNLIGGRYHLEARLAGENWYVRSLALPAAATRAASVNTKPPSANVQAGTAAGESSSDAARNNLMLKQGERINNLTLTIAEGAASFSGRVIPNTEGARLPNNLRAYLVPAEREAAEDVFRYAETSVNADGTFAFNNLAPGHYHFVSRPRPASETLEAATRPLVWDPAARARLRLAAETANTEIGLQPCQRMTKIVTSDK